jgi:hypothetical protein
MCGPRLGVTNGFDDFDTQIMADELDPTDYELWLDFCSGALEDEEIECIKCGEFISPLEHTINDGLCPCCGSRLD